MTKKRESKGEAKEVFVFSDYATIERRSCFTAAAEPPIERV